VVNGVIDELSYICPDSNLEKSMHVPCAQDGMHDQTTIADFFKSQAPPTSKEVVSGSRDRNHEKIYVCDVKTRGVNGLPSGAALRPSKMQLMLYHRLLSSLAGNMVDFSVLATRYNLDPTKMFSDTFIAQIGSLHEDVFYDVPSSPEASQRSVDQWSQDSMTTLLAHNSLSALWSLMITEFQTTMPEGAKSLGDMLRVEYRSRDDGEIIGSKTFAMNHIELKDYVDHGMKWWKGEREAQGVPPEEAYKCRNCEFADGCEWRLKKVDEAKGNFRISRKSKSSA
jgi:exonuclease V